MIKMEVRLLTKTPDDHIIGLCVLDPGREDAGSRTFSLCMDACGWAEFLWSVIHSPSNFMEISVLNESLLHV